MASDTNETSEKVNEEKPKKKWSEKLNIKWKNNLSEYVTIEPLLCIFLIRYLISTLQQPFNLVKKCEKLDGDQYLCECVASLSYLKNDNPKKWEDKVKNQSLTSADRAWNDPEVTRVYDKFITVTELLSHHEDYNVTLIFAYMVQFLIVMLLSNSCDKNSKRKMCLWIPLLGQFLVSIVNIIGAYLFNIIPNDYFKISVIAIESLTGGQELLLFGCFCYMSRPEMKRNIFIGFGVLALAVTVLRNIPPLHTFVLELNKSGAAYLYSLWFYLLYIVLCLLYVKAVLNEMKREKTEPELAIATEPSGNAGTSAEADNGSTSTKKKTLSKKAIIAKALFLDVILDYIKLVVRDRKHKRRWIILLYLLITFVTVFWPYNKDCFVATFKLKDERTMKIDDYDFQGVMLVVISILVVFFKITDVYVAIIATIGPLIGNLIFKSFEPTKSYTLDIIHEDDGAYDRIIGLLICAILLLLVDNTEIRIYLIFKAVSFGATYIDPLLYKDGKKSICFKENFIILAYVLLIIISLGFWLLVVLMKKSEELYAEEFRAKQLAARSKPWNVVRAAQRLKTLASTSSQSKRTDSLNGQETAAHSSNGDKVQTSNL